MQCSVSVVVSELFVSISVSVSGSTSILMCFFVWPCAGLSALVFILRVCIYFFDCLCFIFVFSGVPLLCPLSMRASVPLLSDSASASVSVCVCVLPCLFLFRLLCLFLCL